MDCTVSSPQTISPSGPFAENEFRDLSTGRMWRAIQTLRRIGMLQLIATIRSAGWRESFAFVARNIRHLVAHRLAQAWDRRHGVDTAGSIQLHSLSIVGPNRQFGNECVCTSPKSFDFMMRGLPRNLADYTFIDIGSGKSRTLLMASHYNFRKIVGVEFARELVDCSKRNIVAFKSDRQQSHNFEIVEADATEFKVPNSPLVIFLYNPYSREVFDVVLENVLASLNANPRNCYLIYGCSSHNAIGWARPAILASGHFQELTTTPMPMFLDAVRAIDYAIFRAK
jgi:hypothetical protein